MKLPRFFALLCLSVCGIAMAWMLTTGNYRVSTLPLLIMLALTAIHAVLLPRQLWNARKAWRDGD